MNDARDRLEALSRLHHLDVEYHDVSGHLHVASDEVLVRVLGHLGVDAKSDEAVQSALAARRRALAEQVLEPVVVFWEGAAPRLGLRVADTDRGARFRVDFALEQGGTHSEEGDLRDLAEVEGFDLDGVRYLDLELPLRAPLPLGYHDLSVHIAGRTHHALALSAPEKVFVPPESRMWGLFAPTYALWSERSFGGGGFAELGQLVDLTRDAGGQVVATLPLMASFLDELFQPSPYVPVTKLFWNEMFLDLHRLAQQQGSERARQALADAELLAEAERLRNLRHVDYFAQARLHRSVLDILAQEAFAHGSDTAAALKTYAHEHPRAVEYARFRAVTETRREPWQVWPERLRDGLIEAGDYEEARFRYHLYAQWRAEQQLDELGRRARVGGGGLYLDLPLGVHPDGFDAWREKTVFLDGMNAGAPPDALGPDGQDWGFRPLHPDRIREQRYRYVIESIRTQVKNAGVLRIDHVMGLHRIFCVPWGAGGRNGLYLRYRPEELWAIVTLESQRHGAMIVGEDLGTVPPVVRQTMDRHGAQRMFVLQFELDHDRGRAVREVPPGAVASINTHDTPTFAGYWQDVDIADREARGVASGEHSHHARQERGSLKGALCGFLEDRGLIGAHPSPESIYRAAAQHLARGPARVVLLNVEDLWLEPEPQNVPGTSDELPNWRRKLSQPIEAIPGLDSVRKTLRAVAEGRAGG